MQPITRHEIKEYEGETYTTTHNTSPNFITEINLDYQFKFNYCVSFRDPNLPEWILVRGYWNDEGIWTPDGIFPM